MRKQMLEHHMREVGETFIRYLLKIDAGRMNIPCNPAYSQIGKARAQVEALLARRPPLKAIANTGIKAAPAGGQT
jgi:hypothetical protein